MASLIFYKTTSDPKTKAGEIIRVITSSLPKEDWDVSVYGCGADEASKLFDDKELPDDLLVNRYLFDGQQFTKLPLLEPEPRTLGAEIDEINTKLADYDDLKARVEKLEKK